MLVTEVEEELELLPPGFQRKFAPGVVDDPFNVTELVEQLMSCGLPAFTFGAVVLLETVTVPKLLHPFDGSVTVSV
jgi:uncharacterized protein YhhL (DUF1145 family)